MVGTLDAIARGLPLLKDLFRGEVISMTAFLQIYKNLSQKLKSGEGKKGVNTHVKMNAPKGHESLTSRTF